MNSSRAKVTAAPQSGAASAASPLAKRYRSLFVVGRGGMGAVEAALELQGEGFERVVALKRLLPDGARDRRRAEMFLREARLAAMLDHPNVVRAYDFGEVEGELFLAMEYIEGQTLSHVVRALSEAGGDAELGASLSAHVLAEVCEGLHAAHELRDEAGQPLNLVHRDVSPQNVMVANDGHVRLLDFGVAKIEAECVTKTGEVKGKTAYMSPEQAMGEALDRRSDLFGVGAVLFECLTLRRMWGDGTDMDVIRKLALDKPPQLEGIVPGLPVELCALYKKLVARDASDRPATAREVAQALRAHVPQGREEAAQALAKLLDEHFGVQAEEQRRRLTASLEEIAPAQARELRESISPSHLPPPPSSVAASSSREGRPWLWVALAMILGGVGLWRLQTPSSAMPPSFAIATAPAGTPRGAAAGTPTGSATAAAPPPPSPFASSSASAPRAFVPPPPATPRRATTRATALTTATAPTIVQPPPLVTARPPPDVDDHPF